MKKLIQLSVIVILLSSFITFLFYNQTDILKDKRIGQHFFGNYSILAYTDYYAEVEPNNFNNKFLAISNFSDYNLSTCFYDFTISKIYEYTFLNYEENDFNVLFILQCNGDTIVKLEKVKSIQNLDHTLLNKQNLSLTYSFDYEIYLIDKDVSKQYSKIYFEDVLNSEMLKGFFDDVSSELKLYIENKKLGVENELTWISIKK